MALYYQREIDRVAQGDIYREVPLRHAVAVALSGQSGLELQINELTYPYVVILTQECDLEQDFVNRQQDSDKHDKCIPSILLAPAYLAEKLRQGEHLLELELTMEHINRERWGVVVNNDNKRYHFLKQDIYYGVPDLVVDFKHYFTIPHGEFYATVVNDEHYVASINMPFREELSQRFAYYLSRIGLPDLVDKDNVDNEGSAQD